MGDASGYELLGQIVAFLMAAVPGVLALVLGLDHLAAKLSGRSDEPIAADPPGGKCPKGMFEDPEERERRRRLGLLGPDEIK